MIPAEPATSSRKLFPPDVDIVAEELVGSLGVRFAEVLTKEVSLIDFADAADSIPKVVSFVVAFPKVASFVVFPKVVSLVGLTEVPWTFPGGNLTEDDCSGGDFRNETFPGGGDFTPEEVCPLLGGDFGDLTKELGFLTGGASRKLLPFDAAGFDLIIICVIHIWHACYHCHHHHVLFDPRDLRTLLLSSLGFPGCWLVNQLFLEEESVKSSVKFEH